LFTIGRQGVFSLIQWSGRIHAEFHVHRITWDATRGLSNFTHPAVTVSGRFFHIVAFVFKSPTLWSLNPGRINPPGLGFSAFARHYSRNHIRFLLLGLLRCFTSPRLASPDYEFIRSILRYDPEWVVPFGNPWINACLRLPMAYRSLLRPSSPLSAKAFTVLHLVA
jgi:hypothetical protein